MHVSPETRFELRHPGGELGAGRAALAAAHALFHHIGEELQKKYSSGNTNDTLLFVTSSGLLPVDRAPTGCLCLRAPIHTLGAIDGAFGYTTDMLPHLDSTGLLSKIINVS